MSLKPAYAFLPRPLVAATAGLVLSLLFAEPAAAQFADCGDTIALYSPTGFSATYEPASSPLRVDGVRLRWDELADSLAGCATLEIDPLLQAELGVELRGKYRNRFDRNIRFDFAVDGQISDPTQTRFEMSVNNTHPNPAAGNLSAGLNLSSLGGIYRFTPQLSSNVAMQVNQGLPPHIGDITLNGFAVAADQSVIYAAVTGVPVVRSYDGGLTWEEPGARVFPPFSQRMSAMAVFPDDPDRLWVAVNARGLWESMDAGETWQQIFPAGIGLTSNVSVLKFLSVTGPSGTSVDRLYLGAKGQDLAYSDDSAASFTAVGDFIVPTTDQEFPSGAIYGEQIFERLDVNDVEVSPNDPALVYVGVSRWGVYGGDTRDHSTWQPRHSGLVVCDTDGSGDRPFGEQRTVVELAAVDNAGTDVLVAATLQAISPSGIPDLRSLSITFVSVDGGTSWTTKSDGYPLNDDGDPLAITDLIPDPRASRPLGVLVATFGEGIWEQNLQSGPGQGNWAPVDFVVGQEIKNTRVSTLQVVPGGDLLVGTSDGGIYQPGVWIDLTRTLNRTAQSFDAVTQLGLEVRFNNPGMVTAGQSFSVKAQNYRGYAVWRATDFDRAADHPLWELIALLDFAIPEACVHVACDELSQPLEVNCFSNKRANCFEPQLDDEEVVETWEFFDRDIFNGFTYWYAVSSIDFGYSGETSPESFKGGMLFSPRWAVENDEAAMPFTGLAGGQNHNGELFQVNVAAVEELRDDEIFVVPNPLVRSAGWDLGDASSVRIVNVTASSRAEIYTVAGDLVREIDNVDFGGVQRGNIEWDTRNGDGEPVASGVYIYRVIDENGGEAIGRFTIIR